MMPSFPSPDTGFNKFLGELYDHYGPSFKTKFMEFILHFPHYLEQITDYEVATLIEMAEIVKVEIPKNLDLKKFENYLMIKGQIENRFWEDWHEENRPRNIKEENQKYFIDQILKIANDEWEEAHGVKSEEGEIDTNELDNIINEKLKDYATKSDLNAMYENINNNINELKKLILEKQEKKESTEIKKEGERKDDAKKEIKESKLEINVKRDWQIEIDENDQIVYTETYFKNDLNNTHVILQIDEYFIKWNVFINDINSSDLLYSRLRDLILEFLNTGEIHSNIIVHNRDFDKLTFYPETSNNQIVYYKSGVISNSKEHVLTLKFSKSSIQINIYAKKINNLLEGLIKLINMILLTGDPLGGNNVR